MTKYRIRVAQVVMGQPAPTVAIDPAEAGPMPAGEYMAVPLEDWRMMERIAQSLRELTADSYGTLIALREAMK
jgi:hypothetical protein